MIYFVDIDNTICRTDGEYKDADPIPEMIAKINDLFDQGHKVVYWTARGQTSGKDWFYFTERQLRSWGCRYDDLRMDKPSFDFIIDDRCKKISEL